MKLSHLIQGVICLYLWSPWVMVHAVADLLFLDPYTAKELNQATAAGYTTDVVEPAQFLAMTTSDFAQYKAIIIGDPFCSGAVATDPTLMSSKATWAAAVTGNIVLIGTDPSYHFNIGITGAGNLITDGINFAAGQPLKTGLYLSFSCVGGIGTVDLLSPFGSFSLGSPGAAFNMAHIVASSPALGTLSDNDLSNWSLSVHEVWTSFPTSGRYAFQTLVIAEGATGTGAMSFGDGTSGVPYILSLGATPAGCGDGIYQPSLGEECDDGNTVSGDGCSTSCKCENSLPNGEGGCDAPVCGDGRYAPAAGEQCDDGNTISGDGCSTTCQCESGLPDGSGGCLPARCGDGIYSSATEQCDDGNTVSGDGCSSTCQCEVGIPNGSGGCEAPRCGDGLFYPSSEQCDDGNIISGDGCSSTCRCEVGLPNGSGGCDAPACGDGVFDSATEQCDDGNLVAGDGCSPTCTCEVGLPNGEGGCAPPACGDGVYDPEDGEQCDDGNLVNGDGCSSTCRCEVGLPNGSGGCDAPICGDGVFDPATEECDDGNTVSGDGCSSLCECELGLPDGTGGCLPPVCGDGIITPSIGEQCDDGNVINGDGCSSTCRCESGLPNGTPSCATPLCGDGVYSPATGEQCDDGNNADGDGCSSDCQCEFGLPNGDGTCAPPSCGDGLYAPETEQCDPGIPFEEGSVCSGTCTCEVGLPNHLGGCLASTCGDGVFDPLTEFCDDGNLIDGDGCSSDCSCEVGAPDSHGGCLAPSCGDGIYQPEDGEQCDGVAVFGCSATCQCLFSVPNGLGGCLAPTCGDGIYEPLLGEQCDDGNIINGDGCSSSCQCELGLPDGMGGCVLSNLTSSTTASTTLASMTTSMNSAFTSSESLDIPTSSSSTSSRFVFLNSSLTSSSFPSSSPASSSSTPTISPVGAPIPSLSLTSSGLLPSSTASVEFYLQIIRGSTAKRQAAEQFVTVNSDGTASSTPDCPSASLFRLAGGLLTHDGATAFASNSDITDGFGPLTLETVTSGVTAAFSIEDSTLIWTNGGFGNSAAAFAISPLTNLIEVIYSGTPPAGLDVVTLEIVSTVAIGAVCGTIETSATSALSRSSSAATVALGLVASGGAVQPLSSRPPSIILSSVTAVQSVPPVQHQGYVDGVLMNPIVGIELVVQVNITTNTIISGALTATSIHTSTFGTQINPIYNTPLAGMPCYVCEMMKEGISCATSTHFTLTTVACTACAGGILPTPAPILFKTCQTCQPSSLTGAPAIPQGTPGPYLSGQGLNMSMPMAMTRSSSPTVGVPPASSPTQVNSMTGTMTSPSQRPSGSPLSSSLSQPLLYQSHAVRPALQNLIVRICILLGMVALGQPLGR